MRENPDHVRILLPLGFTIEEGYEPSLEDLVCEAGKRLKAEQLKITVNRCPELLSSTLIALRRKHQNITTQAAVSRYLTRQGVPILQRLRGIKALKEKRAQSYEVGDERDRVVLSHKTYDFCHRLSLTTRKITVYTEEWVGSAISELACDIGTSQETVAIMALVAGAATSVKWIPARHLALIIQELVNFALWVDSLAA
jgi:hypothetical protein